MISLPLTIVTVSKDDPAGLARTVASASALRRAGAEHILVDGSTPSCVSESAAWAGVVHTRREPRGIADALNAGIAAAQREWIWCLNGDDRVDPRLDPLFLDAWLRSTGADIVIGGTTYDGEIDPRMHPPAHLQWPPFRSWIPHPSAFVRRALFAKHGQFDESFSIAMDYEWWLRVIPRGVAVDVANIPIALFAAGGVSQRASLRPQLLREKARAVRKHQAVLHRTTSSLGARWLKTWLVACRPGATGRP